ncbi:MAG: hypothetical protein LDL33_04255 [Desulfomonile sp.]|nr:hypothetical protein [Desulfomonile sp.]
MKRLGAAFTVVLFCLCVFAAGVLAFVRIGLTGDQLARLIIPRLERSLGWNVSYSSAYLGWSGLEAATLILSDLQCRDSADGPVRFQVAQAQVEAHLLALMKGVLSLERISIVRPVLYMPIAFRTTRPNGDDIAERDPLWLLPIRPEIGRLDLDHGRIVFGGPALNRDASATVVEEVRLSAENITPSGVEKVTLVGSMPAPGVAGRFELQGSLQLAPSSPSGWRGAFSLGVAKCPLFAIRSLAATFGQEVPFCGGTLDGSLEAEAGPERREVRGDVRLTRASMQPCGVFHQEIPIESAQCRFGAVSDRDGVLLEIADMRLPGIVFSGNVRRSADFDSASAKVAVRVKHAELDLDRVFPLVPVHLLNAEDRSRLTAAGLKGRVVVTDASWSGAVSDLVAGRPRWRTLTVNAFLKDVSAFVPGFGLPVRNASGRMQLNADEMRFQDTHLVLGGSPIALNGSVTHLRGAPRIDLFVSVRAQGQDLVPLLQAEPVAAVLPWWLRETRDPQGGITVKLDLKGRLDHPQIKGTVDLDKFQCRVEGLPLPLRAVNGALHFTGTGATVPGVTGQIGDTSIQVNGTISQENLAIQADVRAAPQDLARLALLPSLCKVSGKVPIVAKLEGPPSEPKFAASVDLKGNMFSVGSLVQKRAGVPLTLEVTGRWNDKTVHIDEAYLVIGPDRVSTRAVIGRDGKVSLSVNLPPKGVQTQSLVGLLAPSLDLKPGGRIEGDAALRIDPEPERRITGEADFTLNHVSLHIPGFHKPAAGITGKIRWRGDTVTASLERARIGSSIVGGSCTVAGWKEPRVQATLDFSFLDTTDFTARPGTVSPYTWGEWIQVSHVLTFLARSQGTGMVRVHKGKTPSWDFASFEMPIEGRGGLLRSTNWKAQIGNGTVRGSARFDIRPETRKPLELELQGDHLKIERTMLMDPDRVRVEGDLSFEGRLEWGLIPGRENAGIHRSGEIEVRLKDGVIRRFDALSKIFSVINLGSIMRGRLPDIITEGLPYSRLTWTMEAMGTKWKVKNLKLLSDAARIDAAGMYFSDQGRFDFKVEVSPLVGIDKLISGILSPIITGEGKTLTFTLLVGGNSASPEVRLVPLESLGAH